MSAEEDQLEGYGLFQDEQDEKQNEHDDLDLDPDASDPETEVYMEDGTQGEAKITPSWRKYREFNAYQKAAFKSSRYLPRDRFEEMLKVEQIIDPMIDHHIKKALDCPLKQCGSKLVQAIWLTHKVSNGILISLQRRSVGELVVKCLQYLYFTGLKKDVAAEKIRWYLGKLYHQKIDLDPVNEYFSSIEVLKHHLSKYFEKYSCTEELNVANDSGFGVIKTTLTLVKRFKNSFAVHEDFLIEYMFGRKYDFSHPEMQDFISFILPVGKLTKPRLDALTNMVLFSRKLDTKTSALSLKYWRNAAKNSHFRVTDEIVAVVCKDVQNFRLAIADMRALSKNGSNISKIGIMWTNMILPKGGTTTPDVQKSIDIAITAVKGMLESWTSEFHPKTLMSVGREFLFLVLGSFVTTFARQVEISRKKHPKLAEGAYESLKDPIRKCMNFSIFSRFNPTFHTKFIRLAYLDCEFFADYFLKKIGFAFDFSGFSKINLIKIIEGMTTIICRHERISEHLMWIIPKLLNELENVAEEQSAVFIGSCLCSLLENFIGVERACRGPEHLRQIKDDIDEAALRLFDFYHRKSNDFTMPSQLISVVVNLGPYVKKKLTEKLVELLKQGYEKSNLANSGEFFYQLYLINPEQAEQEATKYLLKRLLTKQEPYEASSLLLGNALTRLGIGKVEYSLTSDNENALKKQILFIQALGTRTLRLSQELLRLVITFLVLVFESKHESVVQVASAALAGLFNGLQIEFINLIGLWEYEEKLKEKKHHETNEKFWVDDLKINQERAVTLFDGIYLGAFRQIECLILGATGQIKGSSTLPDILPAELFYKTTLTEGVETSNQDQATETKLVGLLNLILHLSQVEFLASLRVYSTLHRQLLESCFVRVSNYLLESGGYRIAKLREPFLRLYLEIMNGCKRFLLQFDQASLNLNSLTQSLHFFDDIDMFAKLMTTKAINQQYRGAALILLDNPTYSTFCEVRLPDELQSWVNSHTAISKVSDQEWVFGAQVTKEILYKYFKTFYQMSMMLHSSFDANGIKPYIHLVQKSWLIFDDQFVMENCLKPWLKIVAIEQNQEIKYTNTFRILGITVSRCMPSHTLESDELINAFLELADHMIRKANFSKTFPVFIMLVEYIIRGARVSASSKFVTTLDAHIKELETREESQTTLVELLNALSRILITFKYWTTLQRSQFLLIGIRGLASKDINKRIVWMSVLLFANRLIKKTDMNEVKVRVEPAPFFDANGFVDKEKVYQTVQEIRKRLGLTQIGTSVPLTENQITELNKVHGGLTPTKATHTFSLPWEFSSFEILDDTPAVCTTILENLELRDQIEAALREFLKLTILEYSEAINEANLSIKYNFVRILVETRNVNNNFGKESQTFAALKAATTLLGCQSTIKVFEAIKQEFYESEQAADAKKVLMIMLAAGLASSGRYNTEDFQTYVKLFVETIKPLMNKIDFKSVETIITYMGLALKQTLNYERVNYFFHQLYIALRSEPIENQPYYLRLLSFQYSSSQIMVPDFWQQIVAEVIPQQSFSEIASLSNMSLVLVTVGFNRLTVAYSPAFAANRLPSVPISDLSCSLLGTQGYAAYQLQLTQSITTLKGQKLLAKIEFLKTAMTILYAKRLDRQNFQSIASILSLAFSIDSNEDLGMQQIVGIFLKSLHRLPALLNVTEDVREELTNLLSQQLDQVTSIDSIKVVIGLAGLSVERKITPAAAGLIEKFVCDQRIPLRETIESVLRHQVFNGLPNSELYSYARKIYEKINSAALQK